MKLFEYLSSVKKRPGMYMAGEEPLRDLELQIGGYSAAIKTHDIREDILDFNSGLNNHIWKKYHWSTSCGWADAISRNSESSEQAIEKFFVIANSFLEEQYGLQNAINESHTS